ARMSCADGDLVCQLKLFGRWTLIVSLKVPLFAPLVVWLKLAVMLLVLLNSLFKRLAAVKLSAGAALAVWVNATIGAATPSDVINTPVKAPPINFCFKVVFLVSVFFVNFFVNTVIINPLSNAKLHKNNTC